MRQAVKTGGTVADNLRELARKGHAEARADLEAPRYDARFGYLLEDFQELDRRRQLSEHGEAPLTWTDLDSWSRATGRVLTPWEWGVIGRIDDAYFFAKSKQAAKADD